jgi:hypothetical protein
MMNARSRGFVFFASLAAALLCSAAVWADPPSRVGRLNLIDGSVSFRPATLDEWAPATLNYPMTVGDQLWTDSGARAELHLDTAVVRLASQTAFSILALDDQTTQLSLTQGTLDVRLRDLPAGESFEIATPQASVSLLDPGSYLVDVRKDGLTDIVVRSGKADLSSGSSSITVSPNQYGALTNAAEESFELSRAPAPDAFELWCLQRDQREERLASEKYVPNTMIGYEDLFDYGRWEYIPDYGNCWIPTVSIGWAPYHFGRWAWIAPWGWTWIDDEPWGFAPFHYGRWLFHTGRWCWVPGVFVARPIYAPALVVFIGGSPSFGERVGWFPLGPREVYVPPYRVSNVYIRNINIAYVTHIDVEHLDIRNVRYINHSVSGAMTVVSRQDFVRSQRVERAAVPVRGEEFRNVPIRGMGPSFSPERESILARPELPRQAVPRPPAMTLDRSVVVRRAPPALQAPEARPEWATPRQPRFRVVNPPPGQQREQGPFIQPPGQQREQGPFIQPPGQQREQGPFIQPPGQQREQGPFIEPRQPGASEQPRYKVDNPPPGQQGDQGRFNESRQIEPGAQQGRQGPVIIPENRGRERQPAGPPSGNRPTKRRVRGPNGWEWIEE